MWPPNTWHKRDHIHHHAPFEELRPRGHAASGCSCEQPGAVHAVCAPRAPDPRPCQLSRERWPGSGGAGQEGQRGCCSAEGTMPVGSAVGCRAAPRAPGSGPPGRGKPPTVGVAPGSAPVGAKGAHAHAPGKRAAVALCPTTFYARRTGPNRTSGRRRRTRAGEPPACVTRAEHGIARTLPGAQRSSVRARQPLPTRCPLAHRAIVVISGTIIAVSVAFSLVNAIDKIPVGERRRSGHAGARRRT